MKKNYIAPTSKVYQIGLQKGIADIDVYGGHVSSQGAKEDNIWDDDADEGESVWDN